VAPSKNTDREAREARDRLRRYNARQAVHTHQSKRRVRDNVFALIGLVVVATLATFTQIYYFSAGPGKPAAKTSATPTPTATAAAGKNVGAVPSTSVAQGKAWTGTLELNNVKLNIALIGAAAPQAVSSFLTDAKSGYFKGTLCWRMTNETKFYVLQCGTTSATGADTGAAYSFGPLENTPSDNVYPAGSIVEARTGDNAYGSGHQFFITYKDTTIPADTAGGYSIFGRITSGLDQLNSTITSKGVQAGAVDGPPVVTTKITSVTIK
jgi:peptidyl-prolyl cis-trans isomerase B (cyclophilin B)